MSHLLHKQRKGINKRSPMYLSQRFYFNKIVVVLTNVALFKDNESLAWSFHKFQPNAIGSRLSRCQCHQIWVLNIHDKLVPREIYTIDFLILGLKNIFPNVDLIASKEFTILVSYVEGWMWGKYTSHGYTKWTPNLLKMFFSLKMSFLGIPLMK